MKKLGQSGFGLVEGLLSVIALTMVVGVGFYIVNANKKKPTDSTTTATQQPAETSSAKPAPLAKGTFAKHGDDGYYGKTQVEGYATVEKRDDDFCAVDCEQLEYAFFNITKSNNAALTSYLKSLSGNSFAKDTAIGLGCVTSAKQISYSNRSDTKGKLTYSISEDDTKVLLAATAQIPVRIEVERLKSTSGAGAPQCYSHFTTFKVLN